MSAKSHESAVSAPEYVRRVAEHPVADPESPIRSVLDRMLAAILLVWTSPVILGSMILVRLTSPGHPIYAQERLGRGGRPFTLYKIRSMVEDSERLTGPTWCAPGDPRVTPVGRFLRRTHLDELPQLWNVLRGELSLVGPRPERPEIVVKLQRRIPRYRERLRVRPGLTGLAQVQLEPDQDDDDVSRKLFFDLYYVRNASLWLDLRIMASTWFYIAGVPASWIARVFGFPRLDERCSPPAPAERRADDTLAPISPA